MDMAESICSIIARWLKALDMRAASLLLLDLALIGAPAPVLAETSGGDRKPYFLVAKPELPDPIFAHSVVLMLPPGYNTLVVGLIINKPTRITLSKIFPGLPVFKDNPATAYFGGPVEPDEVTAVLRTSHPSGKSIRILDDLYFSDDRDTILNFLNDPNATKDSRLFLGRAQWSSEQLKAEMFEGAWYIAPINLEMVFSTDPARVWRIMLDRAQLQEVDATWLEEPVLDSTFPR